MKFYEKWMRRGDRAAASEIKNFEETRQREEAFDEKDLGIRPVPLNRIVGSVGRYRDFDHRFRLKSDRPRERLAGIRGAMAEGKALPPVDLYRIKDEFYVLDGNHRVAAAKALGNEFIDARVIEFLPSKTTLENVLYREKGDFLRETELPDAVDLTEVGQYAYLLRQITDHHAFLTTERPDRTISFQTAAHDWYRTIYRPLADIIRNSPIADAFPGRTIADLFAYISFHQWEKRKRRVYGIGMAQLLSADMETFRNNVMKMGEHDPPEMTHWVSAFVLMGVAAGQEYRVMKKLFEMDEIEEVHFIHGEYDLIAKVSLKRQLLSSDSEILGRVIQKKIRRIPNVLRTQTLIPISSMKKPPRSEFTESDQ